MNFIIQMLSGDGEISSKRVITFLAFLLIATAFMTELIVGLKVSPQTFDSVMYIVIGGLGFTASEKFVKKETK